MGSQSDFVVVDKQDVEIETIGKYRILSILGSGGMGVVYKARDPEVGRDVAIKTLKPLPTTTPTGLHEAIKRFRLEARSAGNLRHPGIITVFEANYQDDTPYIVMEYVEGNSLEAILSRDGKLSPKVTFHYLDQVASALDYAHSKGVIHRDIKPGNILIDKAGNAFVLDFGVANLSLQLAGFDNQIKERHAIGTPGYMSPEQLEGKQLDSRSDYFSLAAVTFECLAGQKPFQGTTITQIIDNTLQGNRPSCTTLNPELTHSLEVEFERALAVRPSMRFENAEEMMLHLYQACSGSSQKSANQRERLSFSTKADRAADQVSKVSTDKATPKKPLPAGTLSEIPQPIGHTGEHPFLTGQRKLSAQEMFGFSSPRAESAERAGRLFAHVSDSIGTVKARQGAAQRVWSDIPRGLKFGVVGLLGAALLWFFWPATTVTTQPSPTVKQVELPSQLVMPKVVAPPAIPVEEMNAQELLGVVMSRDQAEDRVLQAIDEATKRNVPQFVDAAAAALAHPSARVRASAVNGVVHFGDRRIITHLLPLLEDSDPTVRLAVARGMSQIGTSMTLDFMRFRLVSEQDEEVRTALKSAIERIGGVPVDERKLLSELGR